MRASTDLPATGAITPPGESLDETLISFNKGPFTPSPSTEKENEIDGIWQQVADQCHCSLDEIEDVYACTALQEAMIALTFKDPRAYTIEHEYRLPREVDHHKLQGAWIKTAQANPILRTRMIPTGQLGCVQAVVQGSIPWEVQETDNGINGEIASPSWRAGAPLAYFVFNVTEHKLKITIHHSICDHWSVALLLRQADAAYRGEELSFHPFRPLVDHVQRTQDKANEFWGCMFHDAHEATMRAFPQLPTVGHSARPTERVERSFGIQDGKSSSSTVGTKIRLAWAILQSVYTGSDDTLFGAVNAGRAVSVPGVQDLSGPALASVPVRIKLCGQNTVSNALVAVQDEWAASMEFEHVGLQNLLRLGPGPAAACHFQTLLSVEPRDGHQLPDIFSQSRSTQLTYDMYSLILRCRPSTATMWIEASFDPAVTEPFQMKRILSQFIHIYEQIDTKPGLTLSDISVVSPEDLNDLRRQNILTKRPDVMPCVHSLIERRTRQQPLSPAISSWDGSYSYLALDHLSSALADRLSLHHVGLGSFVPLLLGKTKWMAVAMLAVMKAGAAFVLLEPSHPQSRLRNMCEAVAAPLVLSCGSHIELAAQLGVKALLNVNSFDSEQLHRNNTSRRSSVSPQDPVYLTFTSGSTGTPKGVIVHHEGFASSSMAHGKPYHFTPESRVLQFASPAFDSCIIEHFSTLIQGGCVCIPSTDDCQSNLVESMNRFAVDVACLTPSVTRIISPDSVKSLKVLMFVGEAVLASDVVRWEPFVHVGNAYGPAECSAVFSVQPSLKSSDPANIGFSTGGSGWVVHPEDHRVLMPLGCTGELLIEGPIVGKGYLSNPEQTAGVFVEAPPWRLQFGSVASRKLYKSGDLVQATGDGSFRYFGRKDTQVKLHGQRLELADIEYHLHRAFPKAHQTLAEVLRSSAPNTINDHRPEALLVAFICVPASPDADGNHEAEFLPPNDEFSKACATAEASMSDVLPSFMIPRFFLPLSHIPLTPSGKTNRRHIQEQANKLSLEQMQAYRAVKIQPEAPSTSREEKLQEIWAKTLNRTVEEIGTTESFFRLGGDSVSAMQVAAGCRTVGLKVAVADIFRFPSIKQLAERIQDSGSVSLSPAGEEDQTEVWFELSPIQKLFFERVPNGHNKFTLEFILRLSKPLPPPEIKRAIEKIVAAHSMLRARYEQRADGQWGQIIGRDVSRSLRFREHRVPSMNDRKALQTILSTSQSTLDIIQGVMLVVDVITTDTGEQFLGLMAHHLVIDLVSWRVLLQDLEDILNTGRTIQPLSRSFQQWCRLQGSYAKESLDPSKTLKTEIPRPSMDYWGSETILTANTWADATRRTITVSKETTEAIIGAANGAFHTQPVEIIQAAVLHAFVQAFDDRLAPTMFSEGHGREPWDADIDISRTVGWFTTIVPLFLDVKKEDSVRRILQITKDGRRSISNNGWAYFASRFLHPEGPKKFQSHSPMEILFNYTGLFQQFERPGALLQMTSVHDDSLLPMAADLPRMALIDVNATVMNGSLNLSFIYNQRLQHQDRLEQWISNCLQTLEQLPLELQQEQRLSAVDFPLLSLASEEQLHILLHQVSGRFDVSPSGIEDMFPCSPIQLGMWLSQLRNPQVYWSHIRWSLSPTPANSINVDEVKQAWQQVVDRQPILRTVFTDSITGQGHPVQVVLRTCEANIKVLLGSELRAEGQVPSLSDEFLLNPKSPNTKGLPPHQLTVAIEPDGGAYCQLAIHHILVDGITEQRLLSEFHQACNGTLGAESAGSYSRYLGYLQTRDHRASESYWKEYLVDVHPCIFPSLGSKKHGTASSSLKSLPFSMAFGQNLRSFCQYHSITISSLLQVAWGMVLRVYTGSESVCFGYLNACRDIPVKDAHDISGPLINLLICRLSLADESSVLSTLAENHEAYARSLDHQHCSLAEVMHSLNRSGQPLFNTAMSLQKDAGSLFSEQAQKIKLVPEDGIDSTEYDLTINITERQKTIDGDLTYWTHAVADAQAELVADTFHHIVLQLTDPKITDLSDINMSMGKNESQMLCFNYNLPETVRSCIHTDIQRMATAQPTSPAVDAWDGQFTYETLDLLSSLLAKDLVLMGVGPEVFVPVCRERSRWTVVAIIAILKAGGAFILLDPSHPVERLQEMVQVDFQCPVIITSSKYLEIAATLAPNTITVEDISQILHSAIRKDTIPLMTSPKSSAYAVFTSGSTGRPKASVIQHQSFLSASAAHTQVLRLDKKARVIQFASYAFDASIVEMVDTLLVGGCICIPSDTDRNQRLGHAIFEMQVNWALLTPSVARILNQQHVSTLKTLVLGGEGMTRDDVHRWSPHVRLMNAYGPSECSVIAAAQPSPEYLSQDESNIGHPTGCIAWVAQPNRPEKLVPVGAVGELLIEGPIVGRGYVNRPEAMAAAFFPYPAWLCKLRGSSHGILYRTGDLVRRLVDGSIKYIGRKDRQVKLRGQRIELAEVEHHVRGCFPINDPEVFADLVAADDAKDAQLVVSIIQPEDSCDSQNFDAAVEQMLSRLRADVPPSLIPSAFVPVYRVPRLVNGKIDRKQLRHAASKALQVQISQGESKYQQRHSREMTQGERILQNFWAQVLARPAETVGPDDNFFRLGGDSIAAMRLAATASEQGIQLGVSDIFLHPKLSDLARNCSLPEPKERTNSKPKELGDPVPSFSMLPANHLEELKSQAVEQCNLPIEKIADIYPCTALQAGMVALTAERPGSYIAYHRFRLGSDIDLSLLKAAWETVAKHNQILHTRFIQSEIGFMQVLVQNSELHWVLGDTKEDRRLHWDVLLGQPLVQFEVIPALSEGSNKPQRLDLVITIHHALYDSWSLPLLVHRAQAAYQGQVLEPSDMTPFKEFIEYSVSQQKDALEHWRREFHELTAEPFPTLPSTSYRPQASKQTVRTIETGPVMDECVSRTTAIRFAWALVQSQYQSNDDVVFGIVSPGRAAPVNGIEGMAGPTIATLPLRVQIDDNSTVSRALRNLQERTIQLIPFEQVGLPEIAAIGPEAKQACSFQTLLVEGRGEAENLGTTYGPMEPMGTSSGDAASNTYAIQVAVMLKPNMVTVAVSTDETVIPAWQVEHMLDQFSHLLQQVHHHPTQLVHEIATLNDKDIQQLQAWNIGIPVRCPVSITDVISQHCEKQPLSIAVSSSNFSLSYKELDLLSTNIASLLHLRGASSEIFVPIYLDRSCWTVVAVLAVLKAGAAFVLLDTSHPQERLRNICAEVKPRFILTSPEHRHEAEALFQNVVIMPQSIDSECASIPQYRTSRLGPDRALYAVFTSGSTGKPKGVVIEDGSFMTMTNEVSRLMNIGPGSRVLNFSSYAFDVGISEILGSLIAGACICVLTESERRGRLTESLQELRPSHAYFTPGVLRAMVPNDLGSLRTIMLGGEPLRSSDIKQWVPHARIISGYGPAECTVTFTVQSPIDSSSQGGNIGFPIAGACWVTDPRNPDRVAPIGAVGELLLQGPQVGRGYLNSPEQTSTNFIPSPTWMRHGGFTGGEKEGRVYRTGDLVRYEKDGSLSFVGRKDLQVKLRGQRFELAEVEKRLQEIWPEDLTDIVAEIVTPVASMNSKCLVVFVASKAAEWASPVSSSPIPSLEIVATTNFAAQVPSVKRQLGDILPDYMLPSAFVPLRRIPHTTSGKVDRKQLRDSAASATRVQLESLFAEAPSDKRVPAMGTERELQHIWAKVLDIAADEIGAEDSFFRLGGDSISALKAASRARATGIAHSVESLFQWKTIMRVAKHATLVNAAETTDVMQTKASSMRHHIPYSLIRDHERAEIFASHSAPEHPLIKNNVEDIIPALPFQVFYITHASPVSMAQIFPVTLDIDRLKSACRHVVAHHSILRTVFVEANGRFFQVILRDVEPVLNVVHCDDPQAYVARESEQKVPPYTAQGTMAVSFTLVTSRIKQCSALILRISHAQYDGASIPLLWETMKKAYHNEPLTPAVQFKDVAYKRMGDLNKAESSFWRRYLQGAPSDALDPLHQTGKTRVSDNDIVEKRQTAMPSLPPDMTMSTLVKAAFSWVLFEKTTQSDIILGQVVHGRGSSLLDANTAIGPCLNHLPVRIRIEPDWTVEDFLHHVQVQQLEITGHDQASFDAIAKCCTQWQPGSKMACLVHHQSDEATEPFEMGGVRSSSGRDWASSKLAHGQLAIISVEHGSQLELMVTATEDTMDQRSVEVLLEKLVATIQLFSKFTQCRLGRMNSRIHT